MRMPLLSTHLMLMLGLLSATTHALIVIYDSGNTAPISDYTRRHTLPKRETKQQKPSFSVLPVHTPSMQPGTVTSRKQALPHLPVPLFMVGSDPLSQRWLQQRREQLIALKAVGMLVEAETEQDVKTIQALAQGLWFATVSGESIAQSLNLHHYPVLISNAGIEQ